MPPRYMLNPLTGRKIKVGGPTHRALFQAAVRASFGRAQRKKRTARRKTAARARKRRGGSNAGKYKLPAKYFCGPSGGAPRGTYPVGKRGRGGRTKLSKKRCVAAMTYARNAPRPCGIYRCVARKCNKKYPGVGKTSKKMKRCTKRKSRFGSGGFTFGQGRAAALAFEGAPFAAAYGRPMRRSGFGSGRFTFGQGRAAALAFEGAPFAAAYGRPMRRRR